MAEAMERPLLATSAGKNAHRLAGLAQVVPFVTLGLGMGLVTIWWKRNKSGRRGHGLSRLDR
jgi:hypothetical protein